MAEGHLEWYEYFIMAVILAISLVIGLVFAFIGGRQKTTKEFVNADRALGVVPVALSIYMSATSGITLLGNVAEVHTYGLQGWLTCLGTAIGYMLGALVMLPLFFELKVTSAFEVWRAGNLNIS